MKYGRLKASQNIRMLTILDNIKTIPGEDTFPSILSQEQNNKEMAVQRNCHIQPLPRHINITLVFN